MHTAIYGLSALRSLETRARQSGTDLMAQAGQATADWVAAHTLPGARILLAAGPGNNGGDALIAARLLKNAGFAVDVLLPVESRAQDAIAALQAWRATGAGTLKTLPVPYSRPDLVVDGLFGIGIDRPFSPAWSELIEQLNTLGAPILALDTPTGLDPYLGQAQNTAIRAHSTLTFLSQKPGLHTGAGADLAGTVFLAPLTHPGWAGETPEGAINHPDASGLQRRRNSHKGSYGTVAIVGGASGMLGAALLAGRASLSAGAGKVLVCTLDARIAVDPLAPELMIRGAEGLPVCDVLAIGPGLGTEEVGLRLLSEALDLPVPLVIDADGLNWLAREPHLFERLAQRTSPVILTPHPAEAARLLGADTQTIQTNRVHAARTLAARSNSIVILKGAGSLIACPDGYYHVNTSGGPALASAGQGDVLTGLVAALLGQGLEPFEAASLAVFAHGQAGDEYVSAESGPIGLTASATAHRFGPVLNRLMSPPLAG
jgi:hydroxyethylthiazole kinase-like uncharacterized protein yjeF